MLAPSDIELIQHTVNHVLTEWGMKPRTISKYMSFSEAIRFLRPFKIGRRKLEGYIAKGMVKSDKNDYSKRNSTVRVLAEDIYKLMKT